MVLARTGRIVFGVVEKVRKIEKQPNPSGKACTSDFLSLEIWNRIFVHLGLRLARYREEKL